MIKLLKITWLLVLMMPVTVLAAPLSGEDAKWLNRITYGIDSGTINAYTAAGRTAYLNKQLQNTVDDRLPASVASIIASMDISTIPVKTQVLESRQDKKSAKMLPTEQKKQAIKETAKAMNNYFNEAMQRHLLRAVYSPAQLKEQMVWFWLNHFNVFKNKGGLIKVQLPDYEEHALRPYALGKFRDLVMATLRHPAMLLYLDNAKNAAGKINENYARELMELHTLGVDGGYTQNDVQELARILTGVGVNWKDNQPKINKQKASLYLHENGFEFNPNRHDFGDKVFLGKHIAGAGFSEVEQVVNMLVSHPSTARFICGKLATYFVADVPPPDLVARMGKVFLASDGDISATLRVMFESKEFMDSLGKKAKDPMHYIVSALRFAYEGQPLTNMGPAAHWLEELGEPLYGYSTPDGYGMTEKDWLSPGQLTRRFEIAKVIAGGKTKLMGKAVDPKTLEPPKLSNALYENAIAPNLSAKTKEALAKSASQLEWNTFLLSSPEFIYH
jgi:uncharacterized protein (DUF1800 family)